jgi:hypothetical protein
LIYIIYVYYSFSDLHALFSREKIVLALNPQNIFIYKNERAFIPDVGEAMQIKDNEIRANLSKLDVFSLGLMTLNAIDRHGYMKKNGKLNLDESVLEKYLQEIEKQGIITDKEFLPVLRSMLSFNTDSRISIEELYQWMVFLL